MKLSVALATYNEEECLGSCLASVSNWVYEIVIVDGKSKDKTQEIAKRFKAKVFLYHNPHMFHVNKQRAIDTCTGDWILQLDADEIISEELQKEIKGILQKENDINGYWIPRKNYFLGRFLTKGGQYPDYTMRLYRKGKGKLPCKDVHEQAQVEGRVDYLKNPLLHYADKTWGRYYFRFKRYTNFIAHQLRDEKTPKNSMTFFNYMLIKPVWWFLKTYIRHKGFMDSWQGFLFSFFSSLRFPIGYIKYLNL